MNVIIKKSKLIIYIFVLALQLMNSAAAYEGFTINPGTRAMGMAGVFSAQANDSSAIWYNPAAIAYYRNITADITVELGQQAVSEINNNIENKNIYDNRSVKKTLKFLSAFSKKIPSLNKNNSTAIGFSYITPYRIEINVNEPNNPTSDIPFGLVEVTYRQISTLISSNIYNRLSLGATIDLVWTDIQCVEFKPCVNYGPTAIGTKIGVLYSAYKSKRSHLKISAIWQSHAKTRYYSQPKSGIGTVLNDYIPNRPRLLGLGTSYEISTPWALLTTNLIYERVNWANTSLKGVPISNYRNSGISVEMTSNMANGRSISFRLGAKLLQSIKNYSSDVLITATGIGYEIKTNHIIDIAIENRRFNRIDPTSNYIAISYAWQKTK